MFDIGWSELLVIGVVALVVVGPKDLPVMFKTFGRFAARARSMAREFQRAMEQAADDSGVKDVANDLKAATGPASSGLNKLKEAADKFEKWDPTRPVKSAAKVAAAAALAPSATPAAATSSAPAQSPDLTPPAAADIAAAVPPAPEAPAAAPAPAPETKA